MPLETATYIGDLNPSNPAHTDGLNQADAHLRLIKAAVQATFSGFGTGAHTAVTPTELSNWHNGLFTAADGSAGAPTFSFASELSLGFYRSAAGQATFTKRLKGNGLVPTGAIVDFPKNPPNFGTEWLECNGTVLNIADYPDLGAYLGATYGGNGTTTFGVPNTVTTGRYRRSRTFVGQEGTNQANQNGSHTHTVSVSGSTDTSADHHHGGLTDNQGTHSHTASGTTDSGGVDHVHNMQNYVNYSGLFSGSGGGGNANTPSGATKSTVATDSASAYAHTHTVSLSTNAAGGHVHTINTDFQGAHSHAVTASGTTATSGGSETRPETLVVITCIKA